MSIVFDNEVVSINTEDYKLMEDMVSDFGGSVEVKCPIDGMNQYVLSKLDRLNELTTTELNVAIKFCDFFGYTHLEAIKKEVYSRLSLFFEGHYDAIDLDGVSHNILVYLFTETIWNIKSVSNHPLIVLLNGYITYRGYNRDVIDNLQVVSLDLSFTSIEDVSTLGNVHTLDLSGTNVVDVSALGNVHTLDLSDTPVTDVSALGNVHTLDLSCTNITDVSALGNVHTLDLSDTPVTDVSALGNVHTLNLSWTNIIDVSALGNVHTLNISHTKVTDVSALSKAHTLNISYTKAKDISTLGSVTNLII